MNKVILTGNLCKDIEIKPTSAGKKVTTNSVAVKRQFKNADGEYPTDFINIQVWGQQAEYLEKYGHKGDKVEVVGRWETRSYKNKDDQTVIVNECIVESIGLLSSKATDAKQSKPSKAEEPEDLPF